MARLSRCKEFIKLNARDLYDCSSNNTTKHYIWACTLKQAKIFILKDKTKS